MILVYSVFIFLFGLCIGSFLNCVIFRLEKNESLKGRSFCPQCRHILSWTDLFPVFSFLFLKGKCRYCKNKISWQYPSVEIFTALIFLSISYLTKFEFLNLAFLFCIASSLIVIFVYDLKHYLIPDAVLLPAIILAFLYRAFSAIGARVQDGSASGMRPASGWENLNYLLAALIASGFFFLIWFISRGKWMGFGDVKLAVLLGLITGFPNILVTLYSAFFLGAILGIGLMMGGKKKLKSEIPFGPFLIAGTFITMFWGDKIIQWYTQMLRI